jgi:hypothetical protein
VNKPYVAAKDKAAGIKAASSMAAAPSVRFKTHKVEVRAQLANLSADLIAWAIGGQTTADAHQIRTAISSSTKAKLHVKAQIDESVKKMKDSTIDADGLVKVSELVAIARDKNMI